MNLKLLKLRKCLKILVGIGEICHYEVPEVPELPGPAPQFPNQFHVRVIQEGVVLVDKFTIVNHRNVPGKVVVVTVVVAAVVVIVVEETFLLAGA